MNVSVGNILYSRGLWHFGDDLICHVLSAASSS